MKHNKYIEIVSERNFDSIARDLSEQAQLLLWEMWRDDLNTEMRPHELVKHANTLLAYFGSEVKASDVQWDDEGNCFLWEIKYS